MYLSSKNSIYLLLYSTIFISAMGVQFPFYNLFTIYGVNLFIVPYFILLIIAINKKDFYIFIKDCNSCKILFYIVSFISLSMTISTITSLYIFDNPTINSLFIIIRNFIYATFFLVIPYYIVIYKINIEKLLFIWLLAVLLSSLLYYFDNPDKIGIFIYLKGQNILGLYVSFSIFFAFYFLHKNYEDKNTIRLIIYSVISMFLLITSLFTWSKSSWVSIIISLLFVIILNTIKRKKIFFLFLSITLISFIFILNIDYILALVANEWSASSGSNSNEERIGSIMAGLKVFAHTYFIGVGPKNYPIAIEYFNIKDLLWVQPDPRNAYIQILSEYGIIAFICFFSMVYIIYKKLNFKLLLDLYLFGALLSILIFANFSGQVVTQQFIYLFLAIILGYKMRGIKTNEKNNISN